MDVPVFSDVHSVDALAVVGFAAIRELCDLGLWAAARGAAALDHEEAAKSYMRGLLKAVDYSSSSDDDAAGAAFEAALEAARPRGVAFFVGGAARLAVFFAVRFGATTRLAVFFAVARLAAFFAGARLAAFFAEAFFAGFVAFFVAFAAAGFVAFLVAFFAVFFAAFFAAI